MPNPTSITYRGDEPMRVNKFLAQQSVCSRREAETLIASGAIAIDGTVISELGHKINDGENLTVNKTGQKKLNNKQSFIINKPEGYVSAQPEDGQIPAARLLVPSNRFYGQRIPPEGTQYDMPSKGKLYAPLGRLDQDSRGLLILSEDGVLAKAIIGENSPLEKEYRVKVLGDITDEKLELLRHGLELDDKPLKPAEVENSYRGMLAITLTEGRNRQIRRMLDAVDLKVLDLIRVRVGPIRLRDLPEGEWRPVSRHEREAVLGGKNGLAYVPNKSLGRRPDPSDEGRIDRYGDSGGNDYQNRDGGDGQRSFSRDRPERDGPPRRNRQDGDNNGPQRKPDGDRHAPGARPTKFGFGPNTAPKKKGFDRRKFKT